MEKGSFHPSPESESPGQGVPTVEDIVRKIPLPNQLPRSMTFKDIPASALNSSTLETLISQNEDLMARLSVSLRKANLFEERAAVLERENSTLNAKFANIHEQFSILQEKDRLFSARSKELTAENATSKEHVHKLEKIYSDLFVQAQAVQRRLQKLERYRARVHKVSPAIQARAKQFLPLQEDYLATKKNLSASHIQTVNTYETKLADVRHQIESLRVKANDRDAIFAEKVRSENQLVHEQRQNRIHREETSFRIETLQRENSELRVQLKETLLMQDSVQREFAELKAERPALLEEVKALRDQVESLQALWSHKQREFEHLVEKNGGMQKLNQSLSVNLNQQRKELQDLRNELEVERLTAQEKIKCLQSELDLLRAQNKEV